MTTEIADRLTVDLSTADLHGALEDPALSSMNLLNEIANRYPQAVQFAAGRPNEEFFDLEDVHTYLRVFTDHLARDRGMSPAEVRRTLYQYGRTKGIVHELVARNLAVDEGIETDPEAVVVTVGCQEAMYLILRALRAGPEDVLLAVAPTYVGLTGAARLVDMPVLPVSGGADGVDLDDLVAVVRRARRDGLRPRACYVMPDFANPSGLSLTYAMRRRLLDIAREESLLLLEDNPYGLFHGGEERPPTLKALDEHRSVVYLGSFAKTALPGARVGYVVADQRVADGAGRIGLLSDQLSKIKSMLTVNTSPIAQAVVGGKLIVHGCSLVAANLREREAYTRNLRQILDGLATRFPSDAPGSAGVEWNAPAGGFFVVLTLPFPVDDALLEHSAREYGVLWTPMRHFYDGPGGEHQLRLSTSAVTPQQIDLGLDRLAALIKEWSK
ncbi:PLP-dependent aminotransferase family protein [Streptomyces sp. H27-H1]|uniref:aminotransferase-like domain-containing protein n=1 Tax=Streptomyces sp. H27-H1 TaxID=2996461 RepID=UPI00226DC765|nr:PLP-dependent aminotransferase family protein [Streptomyces sp. H27-H1]MCY0931125.1 PLP-dependent aminotransferase family protein [Streptomyces sp. H27-H1]